MRNSSISAFGLEARRIPIFVAPPCPMMTSASDRRTGCRTAEDTIDFPGTNTPSTRRKSAAVKVLLWADAVARGIGKLAYPNPPKSHARLRGQPDAAAHPGEPGGGTGDHHNHGGRTDIGILRRTIADDGAASAVRKHTACLTVEIARERRKVDHERSARSAVFQTSVAIATVSGNGVAVVAFLVAVLYAVTDARGETIGAAAIGQDIAIVSALVALLSEVDDTVAAKILATTVDASGTTALVAARASLTDSIEAEERSAIAVHETGFAIAAAALVAATVEVIAIPIVATLRPFGNRIAAHRGVHALAAQTQAIRRTLTGGIAGGAALVETESGTALIMRTTDLVGTELARVGACVVITAVPVVTHFLPINLAVTAKRYALPVQTLIAGTLAVTRAGEADRGRTRGGREAKLREAERREGTEGREAGTRVRREGAEG